MRGFLVSMGLWVGAASAGGILAAEPGVQVVLEITDGSRVVGTPAIDRIKLETAYANMEVPLALVRTIELSGTGRDAHLRFQNGDLVSGKLDATEIVVKSAFGKVTLPVSQLRTIRVAVAAPAMQEGLVLYFSFNTDEGGMVTDKSGAGNNGKVVGATWTREGKVGGAMSFNGARQVIDIGNPTSLQLQNFTIMAWIKRGSLERASRLDTDGGNGHFFGYGWGGYAFAMHPNGTLYLCKVGADEVTSQFAIEDDSFHHVVVTKQGNRVVFYLDGTASPAAEYDGTFDFTTDAAVGGKAENMANTFMGVIDEVAVFNRGLSGDEIRGYFDSQK